jgi:hypothetical protein
VSVFVSKEEGKEGVAVSDDCAMCIDQIHRVGMFSIDTSCMKSWIRDPGEQKYFHLMNSLIDKVGIGDCQCH